MATPTTPAGPPTVPPFVPMRTPPPTTAPAPNPDLPEALDVTPEPQSPSLGDALVPSRDAALYQDDEGVLANSTGSFLFVGATNRLEVRRALIAFDVAGFIPEGAKITSVRLRLFNSRTSGADADISLHRTLAAWDEGPSSAEGQGGSGARAETGDPTWLFSSFDTVPWATAGGDFEPDASATTTVGVIGPYFWEGAASMVADVQSWLDDPSTNFGWMLLGGEDRRQTAKRFDSREHMNEVNRPLLTVELSAAE